MKNQAFTKVFIFIVSVVLIACVYMAFNKSAQAYIIYQLKNGTSSFFSDTFVRRNLTGTASDGNSTTRITTPTAKPQTYFQAVSRGTNIQVGDLQLHLTTAVAYQDYPANGGFNVFLNGWVREKSDMGFKCCLTHSLDANESALIEVSAYTYHVYSQWVVDMQNGEFSCSLSKDQLDSYGLSPNFTHVTFAKSSCLDAPRVVLPIEYPNKVKNSVGLCLKISYGTINPVLLIEWFEYVRLLGVTRVFTFLSDDLDKEPRDVFEYYKQTGFLDADPIHPAASKHGPVRHFRPPRYNQQAWVDEVMACNDCKHRMSGLDYVIVMDIDELIIPKASDGTYLSILQTASKRFPKAGTFSFDAHVVALNWNVTRSSPLHILSKIFRTTFANYDGADRNTRWAFMPHRTFFAQNNMAWPRKPFSNVRIPNDLYTLVHRRWCKKSWKECETTKMRVEDKLILKYEKPLIRALKQLPLSKLLPNHKEYIHNILEWTP